MNSRKFAILACAFSLVLHGLLFYLASRVNLNGEVFSQLDKKAATIQEYRALHLKKPPEEQLPKETTPLEPRWIEGEEFEIPEFEDLKKMDSTFPESAAANEALRQQSEEVRKLLDERQVVEAPVEVYKLNSTPLEQPQFDGPSSPMPMPQDALVVTAPRPEILEIHAEDLPAQRVTDVRMPFPELERTFVPPEISLPSLAVPGELAGPPPAAHVSPLDIAARRPTFGISEADLEGLDYLPPPPPAGVLLPDAPLPSIDSPGKLAKETLPEGVLEEAISLDEFVTVTVTTYPDPAGPAGTFLVELQSSPKSSAMPDVAKDVLFILDRSTSISPAKFKQFKKAVCEVLPALSADDRFNVISFNDRQGAIFQRYVPGNAENIASAQKEVLGLPHGGRTDVFGGVAPFVRKSNGNRNRPLNIFLLTDGQSTVNIYEPNKFLRQISGINPGNVSIFPFSAEAKANRELLDFLGYLNKGEQCHVNTTEEICDAMVRFYSDHSSLIVTNLRCAATSGANVNEIFPKSLPHLYRGLPLRIYGRYENRADTLVFSITGRDAEGRLRDLIFQRKVDQCPVGSQTLPSRWAAQKILYLLSRRNLSENPAECRYLDSWIRELKRQYSIMSPY